MKVYLLYAEPEECFGLLRVFDTPEAAMTARVYMLKAGPPVDLTTLSWVSMKAGVWFGFVKGTNHAAFRVETWTVETKSEVCGMCGGTGVIHNPTTDDVDDCPTCEGVGKVWEAK